MEPSGRHVNNRVEKQNKTEACFFFQRWDSLALTFRVARPGSPWVLGKGLLKFTSSAAGGEAAFESLLGRRSGVTSSLRSGRLPRPPALYY